MTAAPPIATGGRAVSPAIAELAAIPRWVTWKEERSGDKITKVPYLPGGRHKAKSNDPKTWSDFDTCWRSSFFDNSAHGIGIVFAESDDLGGIDLDGCRDTATGEIANWARELISDFDSYTEVSPSGSGFKIFARGAPAQLPGNEISVSGASNGAKAPGIEAYVTKRYFTTTGAHLAGTPDEIRSTPEAWARLSARLANAKGRSSSDQHSSALTPEELEELRKALTGDVAGWHNAMIKLVGRLVQEGAADWFIVDWALQYRWQGYSEEQTRADVEKMIEGARAKGYHKAKTKAQAPEIDVVGGNFATNVRAAIAALQQSQILIYDRGGQLVRPIEQAAVTGADGSGIRRPIGSVILAPVSPDWTRMQLAEVAAWRKFDSRTEKWKPTDPPPDVARTIVVSPDEGRWPYLRAIVRHPVLLPAGRRITAQGYDRETGLLIDAPGSWPPLPEKPTRDDAKSAVEALQHLLRYFPWSTDADCAVALSLILTALASPILDAVPGHAVDAPAAGTGKTTLVNAAAIIATGIEAATLDYGQDPDEAAKRLDSALLAGDSILCLDNIEAPLEGTALCQTITQTARRLRLLGSNSMVTIPCNTFITATGNNICLRGDIVRRMLICRLDAGVERPEERDIPQDLVAEVAKSRGELVRCAQTIMLAYIRAGHPRLDLTPIGSFEDWARLVRAPLVWAGTADPVATIARARSDDPSVQALSTVLTAWQDACGSEPVTVASLIGLAEARAENAASELKEALSMIALRGGKLDGNRLGHWLRRNRDCRVGGVTLVKTNEAGMGGGLKWKVMRR